MHMIKWSMRVPEKTEKTTIISRMGILSQALPHLHHRHHLLHRSLQHSLRRNTPKPNIIRIRKKINNVKYSIFRCLA